MQVQGTVPILAQPAQDDQARFRQIRNVLWRVLLLNLSIALTKLIVGLLTGTLAMIADGIHSLIDTSANLIGIFGAAIAGRPPDADHPYGHRRFETLSTLAVGGLLVVAAWEILKASIDHLLSHSDATATPVSFAVMIFSMLVNLITTRYSRFHAAALHSDVLWAGAVESRSDLVISLSVLFGLAATALGFTGFDTLIALLIVGWIIYTAYGILRKTTLILTDAVAVNPDDIQRITLQVAGVDKVIRVRSRGAADAVYADIDVQVEPATTADHTAAIAAEIESRVRAAFTGIAEVEVHFAPYRAQKPDSALVARAAADALGMTIHEVTEILTGDCIALEMHVEVAPTLTLDEAHRRVSELESRVRAALPDVCDVITHIEPVSGQPVPILHTTRALGYMKQALAIAHRLYPDAHWHQPTIRPAMGGYAITLHCWLPGAMSIQEAHALAEHVETQIRASIPQVQRVTIHTEPPETRTDTPALVEGQNETRQT